MKKIIILFFANTLFISLVFASGNQISSKMVLEMKYGKTNESVKVLQQTLYDFGYFQSDAEDPEFSGKFDKELRDAVIDFQKSNELKVTGEINLETYKTLNEFLTFSSDQEQEEINKNNFIDDTSDLNSYKSDVVDTYNDSSIFSYYSNLSGLSLVKNVINNVFSSKKEFDIFDCFLDPVCSHIK